MAAKSGRRRRHIGPWWVFSEVLHSFHPHTSRLRCFVSSVYKAPISRYNASKWLLVKRSKATENANDQRDISFATFPLLDHPETTMWTDEETTCANHIALIRHHRALCLCKPGDLPKGVHSQLRVLHRYLQLSWQLGLLRMHHFTPMVKQTLDAVSSLSATIIRSGVEPKPPKSKKSLHLLLTAVYLVGRLSARWQWEEICEVKAEEWEGAVGSHDQAQFSFYEVMKLPKANELLLQWWADQPNAK